MGWIGMWAFLIFIFMASCYAELHKTKTTDLSKTAESRIIGGSDTTIEKYPYAVQVCYGPGPVGWGICGGFLVSVSHVVSAAHCFFDDERQPLEANRFSIREGTTIFMQGGFVHSVKEIKVHPLFVYTTAYHNVAVVLMATRIDRTTSVARSAVIASPDQLVPDNSFVTTIGWGITARKNDSNVLNEVTVRKINLETCRDRHKPNLLLSSVICAGVLNFTGYGKGPCMGDAGGPLLYQGIVVGVTSTDTLCASRQFPDIYSRVANYSTWITNSIIGMVPSKTVLESGNNAVSSKDGTITLIVLLLLYLILSV